MINQPTQPNQLLPRRAGEDFDKTISRYYQAVRSGKGGLFLAVCRGKVGADVVTVGVGTAGLAHRNVCVVGARTNSNNRHQETDSNRLHPTAANRLCQASEGIDFADDNARAVVVLSIPYPNLKDTK